MARNVEQEQAVNFVKNCLSILYNGTSLDLPELPDEIVQNQQRTPVELVQTAVENRKLVKPVPCLMPKTIDI